MTRMSRRRWRKRDIETGGAIVDRASSIRKLQRSKSPLRQPDAKALGRHPWFRKLTFVQKLEYPAFRRRAGGT